MSEPRVHKAVSKHNFYICLVTGGQNVSEWNEYMEQVDKLEFHPVYCKDMAIRINRYYEKLISFMLRKEGGDNIICVIKKLMIGYASCECGWYCILPEFVKEDLTQWEVSSDQEWEPTPKWNHNVALD